MILAALAAMPSWIMVRDKSKVKVTAVETSLTDSISFGGYLLDDDFNISSIRIAADGKRLSNEADSVERVDFTDNVPTIYTNIDDRIRPQSRDINQEI